MGLDRWIKPDKEKKKEDTEKTSQVKKSPVKTKTEEKPKTLFKKYLLICPKAKCKYQRTLMKKKITQKDKLCPRCKTEMKIKKK